MKTRFYIHRQAYARRIYLLLAYCMLLSCALTAQEFPYPSAHYPLLMEKYKGVFVLQAWDVSGNARHGNTWDPVNKRYYESQRKGDYGFLGTPYLDYTFPTHVGPQRDMPDIREKAVLYKPPVAEGSGPVDLHVTIPDPFPDLTSTTLPFTVCFWLNVADADAQQTLINTPHFGVWLKDKRIYVEHSNASTVVRSQSDMIYSTGTWCFIAISAPSPTSTYTFYIHDANSIRVSGKDLSSFTFNVPLSKSQILDADFKEGSIFGVRFYKTALTESDLNAIRNEDNYFGESNLPSFQPRVGPNHYIKRNMYSHFPFDKQASEAIDKMKTNLVTRFGPNDALTISTATAVNDRNSNSGGAIQLSNGGRLTLNPFFGNYLDDYISSTDNEEQSHTSPKGFTISFWIKLNEAVTSDRGVIYPPFDNQTPRSRVFGLTDIPQSGTQNSPFIWGYSRINDRLSMRRYNEGVDPALPNRRFSWELWHYDPVSFKDAGWYHVVYSQYANWFKTFIYRPDGTPVCQGILWEIQQALVNNSSTREWFIGALSGETQSTYPDLILDDFKIFNWPLIPAELDALHESETETTPGSVARSCGCSGDPALQDEPAIRNDIVIYPNPAKDKVTIGLQLSEESAVQYRLTDLQGRILRTGSQKLTKGRQSIQLEGLNLPNGVYLLQVEAGRVKETTKLIIQN